MRCRTIEANGQQCKLVSVQGDELCPRHGGVEIEIAPLSCDDHMDLLALLARRRVEMYEWIDTDDAWTDEEFKGWSDENRIWQVSRWEEALSHIESLLDLLGGPLEKTVILHCEDDCADADPYDSVEN